MWSDEASVRLRRKDGRFRFWMRSGKEIPTELALPQRQCGDGRLLILWERIIWFGGSSDLAVMRETMSSDR